LKEQNDNLGQKEAPVLLSTACNNKYMHI
jgi:hypothetical protein